MKPQTILALGGLLVAALALAVACHGTFDLQVETTPLTEATIAALEAENARMSVRLTLQPAAPTPLASATPGTAPTIDLKAIERGPSGALIVQLLHDYVGITLGDWAPDGVHLLLYAPAGPLEGRRIPDVEPVIVDVESGTAWSTGGTGPYQDRFAWLPNSDALFVAGSELWRAQANGGGRRSLTGAVHEAITAFILAPDGHAALARGEQQYWLVPAGGGTPRAVAGLPGGDGGWSWSTNSTQVALWHEDGLTYQVDPTMATATPLAKTPIVGGQPVPPIWLVNNQLFLNAPVYPGNGPAMVSLEDGTVHDAAATLDLPSPEHGDYRYHAAPGGTHVTITVADLDQFTNTNYLWDVVTGELTEVGPPVDTFTGGWNPTGGQVEVQLGAGDEEVLAVLDVSSGEVRRLAKSAWPPTIWTPDGSHITFASPEGEIWIVPAGGTGEAERLLPSLGENPVLRWSSDDQRLAIATDHRFGPFHEKLYIVELMPVAGETLAPTGPEGQLAVLIGGPPVSLIDLAGGPPRTLGAENMATYGALFFQWSPDGEKIVYSTDADLWLLDVESGESQQLTNNRRWDLLPAWSPDGALVAFTSRPLLLDESKTGWGKGAWGGPLAVTGANGADFRILDEEGNVGAPPSWAPTGRRLAYAANGELRLYDLNADLRTVLTPSDFGLADVSYLDGPAWSPDGRFVAAYFSRGAELADWNDLGTGTAPDAGQGVLLLDLEAQTARTLFEWEGPFVGALASLRWQPGGRLLLIQVHTAPRVAGQAGLWLVDPDSGELTALPAPAYDADWSPDGRWIAAIDLDDRERLLLVDARQPAAEPIFHRWPYGLEGLSWRPVAAAMP